MPAAFPAASSSLATARAVAIANSSKTYNFAFQPRLSVAYQIDAKTVLRAGWGVFYSSGDSWAYLNGGYSLNGLGINSVQASAASFGLGPSSQLSNGITYNPSAQFTTLNLNPGVEHGGGSAEHLLERLGRPLQ